MRVADRAVPDVVLDDGGTNTWTKRWPIRPVIAITQSVPYAWDDGVSVWDSPDLLLWDVDLITEDWIDATCDLIGMEVTIGNPDDRLQFDSGQLVITLDNRTGKWSQYNIDGSPSAHGPGDLISVWATDGTDEWWMFSGRIARWDELSDNVVEIEAFDAFADLAQTVGTYTPGVAGEHTTTRLESILSLSGLSALPHTFAAGVVALTQQPTDQAPLEEMQVVVSSDGGLIYTDSDGKVITYDRTWRAGRSDQTNVPVFSFNECSTPIVVWDAVLSTNDIGLADTVILENLAKLQARKAQSPGQRGQFVLTDTQQQWTTQVEGDTLAAFLLTQQQRARLRVEQFDLYLLDPDQPDLWRAIDWRLFDRLRFIHNVKAANGSQQLDLNMLVLSISHSVTAENWVMSVQCSRSFSYVAPVVWNTELYTWNDTNPLAVWSY